MKYLHMFQPFSRKELSVAWYHIFSPSWYSCGLQIFYQLLHIVIIFMKTGHGLSLDNLADLRQNGSVVLFLDLLIW
jgi:hypothetical protein